MQWRFWKRKKTDGGLENAPAKLRGPKALPQQIGGYLVIHEKLDPDWVWSLKCVVRRYPERRSQYDFRVYDPDQVRRVGLNVANFHSLDDHADLILFQGNYNKYLTEAHFDTASQVENAA